MPHLLTQFQKSGLTGSAIVSRDEFLTNWKDFTKGMLDGLDWNNVFCAGGAVLGTQTLLTFHTLSLFFEYSPLSLFQKPKTEYSLSSLSIC
jgi:hypothetical protein